MIRQGGAGTSSVADAQSFLRGVSGSAQTSEGIGGLSRWRLLIAIRARPPVTAGSARVRPSRLAVREPQIVPLA